MTRTPPIENIEELRARIGYLHELSAERGRGTPDVLYAPRMYADPSERDTILATVERAEQIGVTWLQLRCRGATLPQCVDELGWFADTLAQFV